MLKRKGKKEQEARGLLGRVMRFKWTQVEALCTLIKHKASGLPRKL